MGTPVDAFPLAAAAANVIAAYTLEVGWRMLPGGEVVS